MASPIPIAALLLLVAAFGFIVMPSCMADNILYSDEVLYAGQSIQWGSYQFIMQTDCNLVLYKYGQPVWASNTGGSASGCHANMQSDGNLVVYDSNNSAVWASGSNGASGNYVLVVQKDGNVVIYGTAVWATGTYGNFGYQIAAIKPNATAAKVGIKKVTE